MAQLSLLFIRAAELGVLGQPLVRDVSDEMAACAAEKHPELGGLVPPESFQAMIQAWATLHGITCLDAYGQFDWMSDEAREALFVEHPPHGRAGGRHPHRLTPMLEGGRSRLGPSRPGLRHPRRARGDPPGQDR